MTVFTLPGARRLQPFLEAARRDQRGVFVLVRTSNEGGWPVSRVSLAREAAFLARGRRGCVPGAARISESVLWGRGSGGWCHAQIRANHSGGPRCPKTSSWFQVCAQGGREDTAARFRADSPRCVNSSAASCSLTCQKTRTGSTESAKPPSCHQQIASAQKRE